MSRTEQLYPHRDRQVQQQAFPLCYDTWRSAFCGSTEKRRAEHQTEKSLILKRRHFRGRARNFPRQPHLKSRRLLCFTSHLTVAGAMFADISVTDRNDHGSFPMKHDNFARKEHSCQAHTPSVSSSSQARSTFLLSRVIMSASSSMMRRPLPVFADSFPDWLPGDFFLLLFLRSPSSPPVGRRQRMRAL